MQPLSRPPASTPWRVRVRAQLTALPMLGVGLFAGWAWFLGASRLAYRLGLPDAAPALGGIVALGVVLAIWRSAAAEGRQSSIERLVCPSCAAPLTAEHEHRSTAQSAGLQTWSCAMCGFQHARALTCEGCAP